MRDTSGRTAPRNLTLAALAFATWAQSALAAPVTLPTDTGPQTFDTEQFAGVVLASQLGSSSFTFQGPYPAQFNTVSVAAAILGSDLSNGIGIATDDSITLGFSTAGSVVVIWEAGNQIDLGDTHIEASTDGGSTFSAPVHYLPNPVVPDPEPSGYQTNVVFLDAALFGLSPGSLINAVRISAHGHVPAFVHTDILAVAVVPEPLTAGLLAVGLAVLAAVRRFAAT